MELESDLYIAEDSTLGRLKAYVKLAFQMHFAQKIILHGLFNARVTVLLFFMPWLLKKGYWIIWGGDLYVYQLSEKNLKWKTKEFFRRRIIKNIAYLVTGTSGDVTLARQWYGAKGQHIRCFNYPNNVFDENISELCDEHSGLRILVGNSANPSNNHKEVLDKLKIYEQQDIQVFCPLSYGDQNNAKQIGEYGRSILGNKFIEMKEFMSLEDYRNFLKTIDIAIFNHKRQQGFGNTLALLGYGKKVFIRKESTLNEVFESLGITVYDSQVFNLEPIDTNVAKKNYCIVQNEFSRSALVKSLEKWIQ